MSLTEFGEQIEEATPLPSTSGLQRHRFRDVIQETDEGDYGTKEVTLLAVTEQHDDISEIEETNFKTSGVEQSENHHSPPEDDNIEPQHRVRRKRAKPHE